MSLSTLTSEQRTVLHTAWLQYVVQNLKTLKRVPTLQEFYEMPDNGVQLPPTPDGWGVWV